MKYGYVLYDPKRSKILVLTKENEVKFIDCSSRENITKGFCLKDMSSMKSLYLTLKEKNLVDNLDIVDIQELYRVS